MTLSDLQGYSTQGVALRTGPPCSVSRPTSHAPGRRPGGDCPPTRVTDEDRHQREIQYDMIRVKNVRILVFNGQELVTYYGTLLENPTLGIKRYNRPICRLTS